MNNVKLLTLALTALSFIYTALYFLLTSGTVAAPEALPLVHLVPVGYTIVGTGLFGLMTAVIPSHNF